MIFENLPNGKRVQHKQDDRKEMPARFMALSVVSHCKELGVESFDDFEHAKNTCVAVCKNMNLLPIVGVEAAAMMTRSAWITFSIAVA